jgi:hypothetical protein
VNTDMPPNAVRSAVSKREVWAAAIVGSGPIVISVSIRECESYHCPLGSSGFW